MNRNRNKILLIRIAIIISAIFSLNGVAKENTWHIQDKLLPPPAGASDELRQSICATTAPNISASRKAFAEPEKVDWKALVAQRAFSQKNSATQLVNRLNVEVDLENMGGVNVYRISPKTIDKKFTNSVFLYIHGGAYVFGGGYGSVAEAAVIANSSNITVISVDYRMPPEHPFPAAVDDVVTVYKHLLKTTPTKSVAIGGTSAGGGLALAAVHKFKHLNLEIPGAIYGGTPWADLTKTGDSLYTNEGIDRVLVSYDGAIGAAARLYANGNNLKNPLISPIYGDFSQFPATYLVTGTRDMFLSDTARVHQKLKLAGVEAQLNVYEGMSHAGYIINLNSPESRQVYRELKSFLISHLE